jgi:hypothetical protein
VPHEKLLVLLPHHPAVRPPPPLPFSPSSNDFLSAWGRTGLHSFIPAFRAGFLNILQVGVAQRPEPAPVAGRGVRHPPPVGRGHPRLNPLLLCPSPARGITFKIVLFCALQVKRRLSGCQEGIVPANPGQSLLEVPRRTASEEEDLLRPAERAVARPRHAWGWPVEALWAHRNQGPRVFLESRLAPCASFGVGSTQKVQRPLRASIPKKRSLRSAKGHGEGFVKKPSRVSLARCPGSASSEGLQVYLLVGKWVGWEILWVRPS